MRENDSTFINQVVDSYYSTIDSEHPQGNMSYVADTFKITRAKVNKILITAGVIDSPLHRDIMKLKDQGYDADDIASALGVSVATVRINMPYEKVIYNGEVKSPGAGYVEEYRKREKVFLENVVRNKTILEKEREIFFNDPESVYMQEISKMPGSLHSECFDEEEDDPIHLMPEFTEEESKLFKLCPDVMVLHIELDDDLSDVKDLAQINYPRFAQSNDAGKMKNNNSLKDASQYTISRDILVPSNIPLHNLHYAINRAFGFTNSHLHEYTLSDHDFAWFTENKISKWKKYAGLIFKNPIRDEYTDFWDDDYEGGSPKKWMRSKYTGPEYVKVFEETYDYAQSMMKDYKVKSRKIEDLRMEFEFNHLALNEALPVCEILSENGQDDYGDINEYNKLMKECIADAAKYPSWTALSQPFVYAFADTLNYSYDFGDSWAFTIKAMNNVEYLVNEGRITKEQMKEAIKNVCILARPVVIAADGLPLVEDVGGVYGYEDFLRGINKQPSQMYDDREGSLRWAKANGWPGKIGNIKTML